MLTPMALRRLCHNKVASDAHGEINGPRLTPISSAASRSGYRLVAPKPGRRAGC